MAERVRITLDYDTGNWSVSDLCERYRLPKEKRAGKFESEAGMRIWTARFDRIWTTPDPLIEMIQPYARRHHKGRLREGLLADQATDEGDRNYSLYGDEPPVPHRPPG
ncbi:MAG: hypothetical protein ACREFO_13755 [Acetobacteraceae bacterium]